MQERKSRWRKVVSQRWVGCTATKYVVISPHAEDRHESEIAVSLIRLCCVVCVMLNSVCMKPQRVLTDRISATSAPCSPSISQLSYAQLSPVPPLLSSAEYFPGARSRSSQHSRGSTWRRKHTLHHTAAAPGYHGCPTHVMLQYGRMHWERFRFALLTEHLRAFFSHCACFPFFCFSLGVGGHL